MKILIPQDTDWIRRNPIQHTHLAERLVLRGHEVRVVDYEILWQIEGKKEIFSSRKVTQVSRLMKDADVTVIRPGILKVPVLDYVSMLFTYPREMSRQIREFKPDVVLGNDILTTYFAFKSAKKNKIPIIFYAIDIEHRLVPFRFLQPLGKIIERKNIRTADLVLSINEGLREYTVRMGADSDKTHVIRAGFDPNRFDPELSGEEIRKKYCIEKEDILLLFVGWLYHFSGLKEVAKELSKIKTENIKLLIVGDGDAHSDLEDIIKKYDLQNKIILAGWQPYDDIPKLIASSDICLLPAYNNEIMRDIVPIKMYDYLAMKKPVIATKLPGIIKEFGNNNGVVYIDKPEDVLGKAKELFENGRIGENGEKARQFVEKNDWNKITDEFERALQDLL